MTTKEKVELKGPESVEELTKKQIADVKNELNNLVGERVAFLTYINVKQVDAGYTAQTIEASTKHVQELNEKINTKVTLIGQLEGKLRK